MEDKAKRILANNLFMTLATSFADGQPWSTPVFYAIDEYYNFYWYSRKETRHSENIKANPKISVSIFSSRGDDTNVGVYVEGIAPELTKEELSFAMNVYAKKAAENEEEKIQLTTKEDFLGDAPVRMYKLTPSKIYTSGKPTKWKGKWIDDKVEVNLV